MSASSSNGGGSHPSTAGQHGLEAPPALLLGFVLRGATALEVVEGEHQRDPGVRRYALARHDCFCVPPGARWRLVPTEDDGTAQRGEQAPVEVLEVRLGTC